MEFLRPLVQDPALPEAVRLTNEELEIFWATTINVAPGGMHIPSHVDQPQFSGPGKYIVVGALENYGELLFHSSAADLVPMGVMINEGDMYMFSGNLRLVFTHAVIANKHHRRVTMTWRFGELPVEDYARCVSFWQPTFVGHALEDGRQVRVFFGENMQSSRLMSGTVACTKCGYSATHLRNMFHPKARKACSNCNKDLPWYLSIPKKKQTKKSIATLKIDEERVGKCD